MGKEEFRDLIKFANTDTADLSIEQMERVAYRLAHITFNDAEGSQFLNFTAQCQEYTNGLDAKAPSKTIEDRREFFRELVSHTRSLLERAVSIEPVYYVEQPFVYRITQKRNQIKTHFDVPQQKPGKLDINIEKHKLTLRFMEAISNDMELFTHIKRCEKCQGFFFQSTAKEKRYCSKRCNNAVRQAKFQEKKRKGG